MASGCTGPHGHLSRLFLSLLLGVLRPAVHYVEGRTLLLHRTVSSLCSNADHQQADWVGVHERICQMLVSIRSMKDIYDPAVRKRNQLRKTHLIKICKLVAQSKLSEGKHEEALHAAHCCLQTSIDLYGPNTIQLVPAYILLAEANMGLGNLAVVAELLSQAEWAVLKNPELGASVQQQLHRSLGHYHTSVGNLEIALHHFSNDIYFACEEYGLDSSATTKGYFLIADVFARQGRTAIVHSLYSEVAERWHNHLNSLLETHQQHADSSVSFYEKAQRVEMEEMLRVILEFEQKQSRRDAALIALIAHNLAMLWFINGDLHKAQDFGSTALQASLQIPKHKLTEPIQELLQQVESLQTEPQPGSD
uniref:Zinc finger, MYND-type containing 12 n=1 Tax=Poecilia formosa TaxID=48698 RepID=A0A087XT98_POEFO